MPTNDKESIGVFRQDEKTHVFLSRNGYLFLVFPFWMGKG